MKIEISNGELADKVSILDIKRQKIKNPDKLKNVSLEFEILSADMLSIGMTFDDSDYKELVAINLQLWEIEDKIRVKEQNKEFDEEFIELARSVYFRNDTRSEIKKRINLKSGSLLVEEKEYVDYKKQGK